MIYACKYIIIIVIIVIICNFGVKFFENWVSRNRSCHRTMQAQGFLGDFKSDFSIASASPFFHFDQDWQAKWGLRVIRARKHLAMLVSEKTFLK
jgi:hypothetical protein